MVYKMFHDCIQMAICYPQTIKWIKGKSVCNILIHENSLSKLQLNPFINQNIQSIKNTKKKIIPNKQSTKNYHYEILYGV